MFYSIEIKSIDQTIADKEPMMIIFLLSSQFLISSIYPNSSKAKAIKNPARSGQGFKVSTEHLDILRIILDSKDIAIIYS